MPDISQATPPVPPPNLGDFEGLLPPVLKSKVFLPSVVSRLFGAVRRNPLASAIALCAALIGGTAGVVSRFYDRDMVTTDDVIRRAHGKSGVVLIGHGYRIDSASKTMLVVWEVVGCGGYRLSTYPPPESGVWGCDFLDRAVDVYFNGAPTPSFSYDPANFSLIPGYGVSSVAALYTFGVNHVVDYGSPGMVPFDTYFVSALAFVIEKGTNKSVPIATFAACEGSDNFVISSSETPTTRNYTYDPGTGPITVEVDSSTVGITARRSQLAQAFTMCLLLINWALTIGSTYVTLFVVVGKERVHEGVLLLPVTLVLTVPALRDLYVGSPPFGIFIDTFGFFLQMMVVALCSMILLYVVVTQSVQDRRTSRDD